MPPYKPKKRRTFEREIKAHGWSLQKASIDWSLRDENGKHICTIKITHPGGEIPAHDVRKAEKHLKDRGLMP